MDKVIISSLTADLTVEELRLLKKLKRLHILSYDKK